MTKLNQLKPNEIARIVNFENGSELKKKFSSRGIFEGSIIRIISSFGLITFDVDSKIFSVSDGIAKNIRVIKVKGRIKEVIKYEEES